MPPNVPVPAPLPLPAPPLPLTRPMPAARCSVVRRAPHALASIAICAPIVQAFRLRWLEGRPPLREQYSGVIVLLAVYGVARNLH